MKKIDINLLCVTNIVTQFAGIIGSIFTFQAIPIWYSTLEKPSFSPPNWVFAPVWTTLYLMMGIASYLVWTNKKKNARALVIFYIQLVLNALWSVLFFGLRSPFYGLAGIVILWIFIILTIKEFRKISKLAAILLLPYFLWVSFAAILNFSIFILNI